LAHISKDMLKKRPQEIDVEIDHLIEQIEKNKKQRRRAVENLSSIEAQRADIVRKIDWEKSLLKASNISERDKKIIEARMHGCQEMLKQFDKSLKAEREELDKQVAANDKEINEARNRIRELEDERDQYVEI